LTIKLTVSSGPRATAARPLGRGQLTADELPFDEELAIERRQAGHVDVRQHGIEFQLGDAFAKQGFDLALFDGRWPGW